MNKFIIASCIIALTFGFTANPSDQCSCSDYILSSECLTQFGCTWTSTNTCQKVNCATSTSTCSTYPTACYTNTTAGNNSCVAFTSCSSLTGVNNTMCQAQNTQCVQPSATATDTTACAQFKCSLYTSSNCPQGCYVNGSACQDTPTCSSLTPANCNSTVSQFCVLNGQTCQQATCSNFTQGGQAGCMFVKTSATSIIPCFWNSTACIDASTGNLTSTTCFTNTLGAYHWSSSNLTDGSCKSCYGVLLQIVFAIILLLA